ncbi:MFS general substrate transporter [Suillus decipiens]|nr:MFS general substrate transporter [Suillus decipiens]
MGSFSNDKMINSKSEKHIVLNPRERSFCARDRANVGNAKVGGMAKDLNLTGLKYNVAAAVFFFCRGPLVLPSIMVAWGVVMTMMYLIRSYQSLVIARVFLGLSEAGLFPGINYYIFSWYPRSERSKCIAIFFSAVSLGGAFGGLLAYGIERMEGIRGLHGWQWIFCLEGIGFNQPLFSSRFSHFSTCMMMLVPGYAIAFFSPTIINELGYSAANAQLLSVPPFVASAIATILVGIYSDKHNLRGPYILGGALVPLRTGGPVIRWSLSGRCRNLSVSIILVWGGSNVGGDLKRGVVLAMVIGLGNLEGICSSLIYIDPPRSHIGHGTIMGFLSLSIITSLFAMWDYNGLNKEKETQSLADDIIDDKGYEFQDMGDASPLFRFLPEFVFNLSPAIRSADLNKWPKVDVLTCCVLKSHFSIAGCHEHRENACVQYQSPSGAQAGMRWHLSPLAVQPWCTLSVTGFDAPSVGSELRVVTITR